MVIDSNMLSLPNWNITTIMPFETTRKRNKKVYFIKEKVEVEFGLGFSPILKDYQFSLYRQAQYCEYSWWNECQSYYEKSIKEDELKDNLIMKRVSENPSSKTTTFIVNITLLSQATVRKLQTEQIELQQKYMKVSIKLRAYEET